jgi:hydrogenase maturation protein HypF
LKQKVKIVIRGAVQGVGFRPFIYRLAKELDINGWIINSSQGVFIEAESGRETLDSFLKRIETERPKNSVIQSFEHTWLDANGYRDFEIRESLEAGNKTALVLPDISTCGDCLEEIFDPNNRRYLYPFTNCTNCGPRFSIIKDLPYDRCNTTMDEFEMCESCRAEYTDPLNRRFHAEPTACPDCGPQVKLLDKNKLVISEKNATITEAVRCLNDGKIIALKGIGGYQLICDATSEDAIRALRLRKKRNEKPFALMFPDIGSVKYECEINTNEERILGSVESPIVLVKKRKNTRSKISDECAKGNPYLGIMLPYSPLHHILMREFGKPIVATSGNISEEPICITEGEAFEKLGSIADLFLVHNREILRHVDDSIVRHAAGKEMMIRRARGYAPLPLIVNGLNSTVLAAGAHLKNTVSLNKGSNVFVSQHIGDLENTESINAFNRVINDLENFYEAKPDMVICDLHPDYISTRYAESLKIPVYKVQHHYSHVLSCMAENEIEDDVLGVSWDGTGYGTDGTIWGGEFIIPNGKDFVRKGHLISFRLPGGEQAIHDVWKIGYSLLYDVYGKDIDNVTGIAFLKNTDTRIIRQMLDKGLNSPVTSSVGRLFDGVAAILGLRENANFEAQAAMELEFATDGFGTNEYLEYTVDEKSDGTFVFNWHGMIKGIVKDMSEGIATGMIAAKFHNSLAEGIVKIAQLSGKKKIALTGGCFLNKYLLEKCSERLETEGFKVYTQQRVPPGDGGISPGQMKFATYIK